MAAHVLVFPWPLQGHINSMLPFAVALAGAGVHVTFLHTEPNLRRAAATASPAARLRFMSVPDGLPDDHPRSVGDLTELAMSLNTTGAAAYRALLDSMLSAAGSHAADAGAAVGVFPAVSCVVGDVFLPFTVDVAEELGVPALAFHTASACSVLAYLSLPRLTELGEVPVSVGVDLDAPVRGVPGMEGFLRRRDLPSTCRRRPDTHGIDPALHILAGHAARSSGARALIINTAVSLEAPALARIAPRMRDLFAIGPLHAMSSAAAPASTSLWPEDEGCMEWLDGQADKSVVYVSLGSLAVISLEQFTEFLHGLVNAGYAFLWALRPDTVGASQSTVLQEAVEAAANGKARVVDWAPQRDVLRHRAVGCFLTHAGWNSTLEGIVEGVPLVCWPFFGDQQTNSRFVGAVWGTGLDMKDVCERAVVEGMVREAMESGELRRSAQALAKEVRRDVAEGGSSASEFRRLVGFIKELNVKGSISNQ
ncbi:7-deoxyloganetic acid glucosyltransferase [Brachypodium distachyon]|uniref:Glycosyltransferase n=1 Tax=Brachypodium distachyon TaxID=15368 RepID=I1GUC2_BRADI|nr:7-deoxyloganetic acid glucosyltransferase [Brachypodium distachyon]KQK16184.1 hypothetical protein BRADI_1g27275v3 [Brachypodium distachyon]|eukprot:XP_003560194.1 7-deoxyloganetic acid glucosyltransferase [Brachypodium distachyon]